MQQLITSDTAKKITRGRTPLVPVEYEEAVTSLQACLTLDEAKYWSDKSDALAAWAKIYSNDEAGRKARMLKLHAYRRMGQLANEIRPDKPCPHRGRSKSGRSLLMEKGLKKWHAEDAMAISRIPEKKFEEYVGRDRPPSPYSLVSIHNSTTPELTEFRIRFNAFLNQIRKYSPADIASRVSRKDVATTAATLIEASEWLDGMLAALPKELKK